MDFYESSMCRSRQHCQLCRKRNVGARWRSAIARVYGTVGTDFECVARLPWLSDTPTTEELKPFDRLRPVAPVISRQQRTAAREGLRKSRMLGQKAATHQQPLRQLLPADNAVIVHLDRLVEAEKQGGCRGCRRGRMYKAIGNVIMESPQREEIEALLSKLA